MKIDGFYKSDTNIKLALTGLLLKGSLTDFFAVLSLDSLGPVISVVSILLFVLGLIDLLKYESKFIIVSTIVMASVWGVSLLISPANLPYMREEWIQSFIYCLPFMWMGYFFVRHSIYLDYFLPIARVKLSIALVTQIIILINPAADIWNGDYMNAANALIVGLIAVYYLYLFRGKRAIDLVLAIVGSIVILISGSRGALVAIVFFFVGWWYLSQRKAANSILMLVLILVVGLFGGGLISRLSFLAERSGYSTHLVDAVSQGAVFIDDARTELFTLFMVFIKKAPFGYGVMGDRMLTDGIYLKPIYPHNLYLEVLTNFGYIIGGIISLVFTFYLIKFLVKGDNYKLKTTVLAVSSFSFIHLLFSNSYWCDQMFYLLIGVLFAAYYVNDNITLNKRINTVI